MKLSLASFRLWLRAPSTTTKKPLYLSLGGSSAKGHAQHECRLCLRFQRSTSWTLTRLSTLFTPRETSVEIFVRRGLSKIHPLNEKHADSARAKLPAMDDRFDLVEEWFLYRSVRLPTLPGHPSPPQLHPTIHFRNADKYSLDTFFVPTPSP